MKLRPPLWAFPRRWRQRYGGEIALVFVTSGATLRDWLDIVRSGLGARLEEAMKPLVIAGLLLLAGVSLVMVGYSIAEVSEGAVGLHRHWWSAAPVLTFVLSCAAIIALVRTRAAVGRSRA